ncbi:MAG: type II secretion system protein GspL [Limnohabitans sp.]
MRTLIIQLPVGEPGAASSYPHAWVPTDATPTSLKLQWASASLLPAADRSTEVVALVPASVLSWHQVSLPPGLHKQRARLEAALQGLLEERLLDDPQQLHMALAPHWKTTPLSWVAVCERAWLSAHLSALEAAGITVHRIVPEFAPSHDRLHITATGDAETGWLWVRDAQRGVWGLPLASADTTRLGLSAAELQEADIQAEPAAVAAVSERLALPAQLMPPAQHWLAALQSGWDLAQFGFQAHSQARLLKTMQRAGHQLWQQPQWRMARWGLLALLLSQVLGLNAWAWKTQRNWQAQQQAWTHILRQSFADTTVVVDAPLQMNQQVARLRQSSGELNPADLESMLGALGQALPAQMAAPHQWRFETGQLRLINWPLKATEQAALQQALAPQGYALRAEGDAWLMLVQKEQP